MDPAVAAKLQKQREEDERLFAYGLTGVVGAALVVGVGKLFMDMRG